MDITETCTWRKYLDGRKIYHKYTRCMQNCKPTTFIWSILHCKTPLTKRLLLLLPTNDNNTYLNGGALHMFHLVSSTQAFCVSVCAKMFINEAVIGKLKYKRDYSVWCDLVEASIWYHRRKQTLVFFKANRKTAPVIILVGCYRQTKL